MSLKGSVIIPDTPSQRARLHHYVPRFHLRQFAADPQRNFIFAHDKRTGATRRRPFSRVAAEMDLYTVVDSMGEPTDALETSFGTIENVAAPVLRRLAALSPGALSMTGEDRVRLSAYVALQFARVPEQLNQARELANYLGSAGFDMFLSDPDQYRDFQRREGSAASEEELDAERLEMLGQLRRGAWKVPGGREDALSSIGISLEAIGPVVAAMHWTILVRTRPPWLVLGDTPVVLYNERATRFQPAGFATAGTEVHMPISPSHAFLATATPSPVAERVHELRDDVVAASMTVEAWAHALDAVYGHSEDAIRAARDATPAELRPFRERLSSIGGGPSDWDRYRTRPVRRAE